MMGISHQPGATVGTEEKKPGHGANQASRSEGSARPGTTILLIEDDPLLRMTIADFLRDSGFRIIEAQKAEEARQLMLADEPVALVVTDVNLPGQTGLEFGGWVRREFPDVKIIVMSGVHQHAAGAHAIGKFLGKPFELEDLARLAASLIGQDSSDGRVSNSVTPPADGDPSLSDQAVHPAAVPSD